MMGSLGKESLSLLNLAAFVIRKIPSSYEGISDAAWFGEGFWWVEAVFCVNYATSREDVGKSS